MKREEALAKISKMQLWRYLPGDYSSEEEAVQMVGKLSRSMMSNIKDWYNIIFPYVQDVLRMSITEFWHSMELSNLREITLTSCLPCSGQGYSKPDRSALNSTSAHSGGRRSTQGMGI
jgi:hypothetical protein